MTNQISKTIRCIQQLDALYNQSSTVQMLVNNAPAILQGFHNFRALSLQHEMELKNLIEERRNNLDRFKEIAPGMMRNLESILNQIYSLQNTVREYAHYANSDSNARTVIKFTNNQIDQNIRLFNQLTFSLLNA